MANNKRSPKSGKGVGMHKKDTTISYAKLTSMNKEQLKLECRRRGVKASGKKIELLNRLSSSNKLAGSSNEKGGVVASGAAAAGGGQQDVLQKNNNGKLKNGKAKGIANGSVSSSMEEENSLVLWRRPFTTLEYFTRETILLASIALQRLVVYRKYAFSVLVILLSVAASYQVKGPHQPYIQNWLWVACWWSWWVLLGVLSSVGLGTGLHTFLLYLGPHIARVTLAAYECGALNFPQPPYPDRIICPEKIDPRYAVTIWNIMSKVRMESMMWGLGTALGELPPYFMARAARMSSKPIDELQIDKDDTNFSSRAKVLVQKLVEKVGFLGILACASIPNPLFDLAGLTCGHFLVPFWTFFGATLIGKAIIKMHLQKMFVIIAFNELLVSQVLSMVEKVPIIGPKLEEPLLEFLKNQKARLHSNDDSSPTTGGATSGGGSLLSNILEKFVLSMVVYFVVSIVNSLAQNYQKRINKSKKRKE